MRSSTVPLAADPGIARARPLLGTVVSVRAHGLAADAAHRAIDAAFSEIAAVHHLMSAQDASSELSAINAAAASRSVTCDPRTLACIARALALAEASEGVFDPVAAGGAWRDIQLETAAVRLARPLRLDLSGIAKGYAVDLACRALAQAGASAGLVNAGGDLRVFGSCEEPVALRPHAAPESAMLLVAEGALASSDPRTARAQGQSSHRDGRSGARVPDRFVAVAAPTCMDADALTKVVLALGPAAAAVLDGLGAAAYLCDEAGWALIGAAA